MNISICECLSVPDEYTKFLVYFFLQDLYIYDYVASVPGLPRSVRVLIMRRRQMHN